MYVRLTSAVKCVRFFPAKRQNSRRPRETITLVFHLQCEKCVLHGSRFTAVRLTALGHSLPELTFESVST